VLAGVVAGLAARAEEPAQATVHGVNAHAEAGRRLAERVGRFGFLARELLDEVPMVLDALAP
jgi:NAD(P)H-hydrate repair Nnr-like enzyme with NAD(P)H-hydrate dehydratase domain